MKIDLSKLPEGTKWIAIDSDGSVYGYSIEPNGIFGDDWHTYGTDEMQNELNCWRIGDAGRFGNVHG